MKEKEEEERGWNEWPEEELQRSHESSLPVSRTMETFCGGVPTERETVRETLWWKSSLLDGRERGSGAESFCVLSGKITASFSLILLVFVFLMLVEEEEMSSNENMRIEAVAEDPISAP